MRAVIIESGRGSRRLDPRRSEPMSLQPVADSQIVLDWLLHAFREHGIADVVYVGGYHIEKVIERFPHLQFRFDRELQYRGELASLALAADAEPRDWLVVRAGTVLLPDGVGRLIESASKYAVGTYSPSTGGDGFAGAIRLAAESVEDAVRLAGDLGAGDPSMDLADLAGRLATDSREITSVDLDGLAAPVEDRVAVARVVFKGKGHTLEQIGPLVRSAVVVPLRRFSVAEWARDSDAVIEEIRRTFSNSPVIVRSSAADEDTIQRSAAGRYHSVADVRPDDAVSVREAVERVIASYTTSERSVRDDDEVLVQTQVSSLSASGVVLTRDLESSAPYFVVNLDAESGRSDLVTSGGEGKLESHFVAWSAPEDLLSPGCRQPVRLARELMALTHNDSLDIEFGVSASGESYLFQVRPLVGAPAMPVADEDVLDALVHAREFVAELSAPSPALVGETTLLGRMPDWNPAEMIGTAPRPLALSLYQHLIGDANWAAARARIGYRDVRPTPLIVAVAGSPYVDVRASLNSFLPEGTPTEVARLWVDACLSRLREEPALHDKIEFDVTVTCLDLDWNEYATRMAGAGLPPDEIEDYRKRLLVLTERVVSGDGVAIERLLDGASVLARRRQDLVQAPVDSVASAARRARHLLDDCGRYGVVPFAILARYAFIAMSLMRSLRNAGVFSLEEYEAVLRSVPTVATDFSRDLALLAEGELNADEMVRRYGHLRPGSYDITSPNYATAPDLFMSAEHNLAVGHDSDPGAATRVFAAKARQIDALLRDLGFTADTDAVGAFVVRAIAERERAKFEFMKNIDAALSSFADLGAMMGLSREDVSFLPLGSVLAFATESTFGASTSHLEREIGFRQKQWALTSALRLPDLIRSPDEVLAFELAPGSPNYITSARVVASVVMLDELAGAEDLEGKIVVTRAADPGHDWLFGHRIAGLVTQYGGVASHMAIRAAEFGLPAAIGCGPQIYDALHVARRIELDCGRRRIRVLE